MRSVGLLFLLSHITCSAQLFEWTQLSPFPGTARDDASAFTIGNSVFVGTGRDVDFVLTNDWYAFDMPSQTWAPIAALPASGRQYCSAFTDGAFGYLFGGVDENGPLNELWRYDPALDAWEPMSPLPALGRYATVAFDNGMVCTGLLNGGVPTNECWRYDVATDSWMARASVPGIARHRASGSGTRVQVLGGADAEGNALADGYGYDGITDAWWPVAELPAPRIGADLVFDADFGATYVVGGASSSTQFHAEAWESFNSGWSALPNFGGGPRRGAVMAFIAPLGITRYVLYGTGVDNAQRYSDWWVYTILTESILENDHLRANAYPNPSTGLFRIDIPLKGPMSATIHDLTGRAVTRSQLGTDRTLDLTSLGSGEYIIQITNGKQTFHSRASIIGP